MFKVGEYAVCPGHGVGQICDIEERDMGAQKKAFYVLKVSSNGMTVMVPTDSEAGIRSLANEEIIEQVFNLLADHNVKVDNSTWNRRYREYMLKIKTGSLVEIADVLRALLLLKSKKNLSFGEKKMVDSCRDLLAQEIALSKGIAKQDIAKQIDSCFI